MPGGVPVATMAINWLGVRPTLLSLPRLLSSRGSGYPALSLADFAEEQERIAEESTNGSSKTIGIIGGQLGQMMAICIYGTQVIALGQQLLSNIPWRKSSWPLLRRRSALRQLADRCDVLTYGVSCWRPCAVIKEGQLPQDESASHFSKIGFLRTFSPIRLK